MSKKAAKAKDATDEADHDEALQKEQLTELNMELNNKNRKYKAL